MFNNDSSSLGKYCSFNLHVQTNLASEYIKQILPDLNGEIDNSASKMKDFNAYISVNTRQSRQKVTKRSEKMNYNLKLDFIEMLVHVHKHNMDKTRNKVHISEYRLFIMSIFWTSNISFDKF